MLVIKIFSERKKVFREGKKCEKIRAKRNISSNSNTDGLAAIVSKMDNLGCDMKKLKENVHAIQVGCQICEGHHLDKECPLNEEVKQVEEVKYGASVNVMPWNTFEYLRLANLRNTNMLVEVADMTKKAPLGIDNARVSYDMEKKYHNFTSPTEKFFIIKSDLENRPQSPACSKNQSRNLPDRSLDDSLHNRGHMLDKIWEYCKEVHKDSTYWWHDYGFEEEERDEIGIEIKKHDPSKVQVKTFKVPAARR
nr:hypothetical protein [Tanacetum cinerariifolium]